ncbi:MAG: glycosyltransferase family 4 protein [Nitrospira sp.]|nr:glycosyltransferase family 4 protein [Candidatus Brocadiales bacterium]MBL7048854.1 glycosyltransferase family 4 protein [Nitrospira sp.]
MKIVKVWLDDYPWDVRVEKIAKALLDDGHEVHLVCSNKRGESDREEYDGIQLHRMRIFKNDLLNKVCSIPAFFNPFWIYKIYQVAKHEQVDVILVRDLPLVISALLVSRIYKVRVLFDMAENYPSMWKEHVDKRGANFINHLLKNHALAVLMENYVLKRVDHTIVVVEESRDRLIKKGVSGKDISIVSNTPDLKNFENLPETTSGNVSDKFEMLYVGAVNGGRGLDIAIKAIPRLKELIPNLSLVIAGSGDNLEELKVLADKLEIRQYVKFLGWVDTGLVPSYINNSSVCIVPHDATEFVNSTIPNKLFDYMACKKPVIVSDAMPLRRVVKESNCGTIFKSRDIDDFIEKVMELQDSGVRHEKGENGFEMVKSKYNWAVDMQKLKAIFT